MYGKQLRKFGENLCQAPIKRIGAFLFPVFTAAHGDFTLEPHNLYLNP